MTIFAIFDFVTDIRGNEAHILHPPTERPIRHLVTTLKPPSGSGPEVQYTRIDHSHLW